MKRVLRLCALIAFAGMAAACLPISIFEDVGTDPHPPEVQLLGVGYQPAASAEGTAPEPVFFPPEGFVVRPNDSAGHTLIFNMRFTDAGGDIVTFNVRDRNSDFTVSVAPTAPLVDVDGDGEFETLTTPGFFTGTSGTVYLESVDFSPNMQGLHHMELWAEDSHGSRSEKVTFTFTVVI